MKPRSTGMVVAAVAAFVFALGLRAWHIGWGLPFNYEPWEQRTMDLVLDMARRGSLDPGWLGWPSGALYLALGPVRVLSWLAGVPLHGVGAPTASPGMLNPGQDAHLLAARLVVAVLGAALAAISARAAWGFARSNTAAWVAGLLAACLPVLIDASHHIGPVAPASFGVALTLWAALVLARQGRLEHALWAGAALGLATGFHYAAALAAAPVLVAAVRRRGLGWKAANVLVAAAGAVGAFLATTPFALARPASLARGWLQAFDSPGAGWLDALIDPGTIGPIPLAIAGAGLLFVAAPRVRRELAWDLAVLVSFVAALTAGSAAGAPAPVLAALVAPAIALLAGIAVAGVAVAVQRRWLTTVLGVVVMGAIWPVAVAGGRAAWDRGAERTESIAYAWFQQQVPAGARIIRDWAGPQLRSDRFHVIAVEDVSALGTERITRLDPDYIVLAADPSSAVSAEGEIAARFCPDPGQSAGPRLLVLAHSERARTLHTGIVDYGPCGAAPRPRHP